MHTVWQHRTKRFTVRLEIEYVEGYQYDGEDEDGSTQRALDSGEFVAFDSLVSVSFDGHIIGTDSLGGSVYAADDLASFYTAHRDPDPMNRNCEAMRKVRGSNAVIGHYFPDMVRQAIAMARSTLCNAPRMRCAA